MYATIVDDLKRHMPGVLYGSRREILWKSFFDLPFSFEDFNKAQTFRGIVECQWEASGRPYYKVNESIVSQLVKTDLGNIPADAIVFPPPHTFCVTLTKDNPLFLEDGQNLRSMLVQWIRRTGAETIVRPCPTSNRSFTESGSILGSVRLLVDMKPDVHLLASIETSSDTTVQEAIDQADRGTLSSINPVLGTPWKNVIDNAFRLLITLGFLAEARDPIITPDVLREHFNEYYRKGTGEDRRQWIEERSIKRGKRGWLVGHNLTSPVDAPEPRSDAVDPTGRELSHAHIRRGHVHIYRCGTGRTQFKARWVAPTTVRPDLPFH